MTLWVALVVLVALSAFFSASETAFSSLNQIRLKSRAEDGDNSAARVLAMAEKYDKLLSTILIGNNIVNIAAASIGTIIFTKMLGAERGATVSTMVLTVVGLIFGEVTPKSLAKEMPETVATAVAPVLSLLMLVFTPLTWLFSQWKRFLGHFVHSTEEDTITEGELMTMVSEAENDGELTDRESELIRSAIEFDDVEVEEILTPRVVTYTGKLYKAWQLLQNMGEEKSPYENVLREVAGDLEALNKSLRALNASIGHYIDRLTRNRTPQEVLELFDQYEEKVVAAAYHRFKTSDNLFNYRAILEEGLDDCETNYLPQLALDYARVERCAPGEAAPRVRALIQQQRDALEEMSTLMKEIDASHIRYRKRAVQRAQFLLLSDRSAQGSVTALLRRYAEDIRTPEQLFEPDDGPLAARLRLWPVQGFGEKPLYPPAAPGTDAPLAAVQAEHLDEEQLRREQKLLLDYARMAVTEENVDILARQALAARPSVSASTLADEYPNDFARIIGLHTYSQSPRRCYDIQLTGEWATRGGFRFEEFTLTPRKEDAEDDRNE